jgi:peptidoglycan hydrolase-like protein with peptidoglycan-binding domain
MDIFGTLGKLMTNRDKIARLVGMLQRIWAKIQPEVDYLRKEAPEVFVLARDLIAVFAPQAQTWLAKSAPLGAAFDIKWLQRSLNELGFGPLETNSGIYGPKTQAAVGKFQKAFGLEPDEWAGTDTISQIIVQLDKKHGT